MPPEARLLGRDLVAVSSGVDLFAEALEAQAVPVARVDWRPPPEGTAIALTALWGEEAARANETALARLLAAQPVVVDVRPAIEVVPGLARETLLHAGPPVEWARMSGPLRGAIVGALLYEGLAASPAEAEQLAASGALHFAPCHHHRTVGPMAGVVSASMPVWVVENGTAGNRAYATLNEGLGKVLRFGAYAPEVIARLRWIQEVLGPALGEALRAAGDQAGGKTAQRGTAGGRGARGRATGTAGGDTGRGARGSNPAGDSGGRGGGASARGGGSAGGIDVRALVAQALQMGDECHNRNRAASSLFARMLAPHLAAQNRPAVERREILAFIAGNDHFFLNVGMAACKAALDAAHGVPHSTLVTAMARNGTEFGIRVSGLGTRWFVGPARTPVGLYFPGFGPEDANPDLGDSAITETAGLGGFAMAGAPAIVQFVGGTPADALQTTRRMYEITLAEHDAYRLPALDFRGTPTGIDLRLVVQTGILPQINTGIAHRDAGIGQIGAGLVTPPPECFARALDAAADAARGPGGPR